MAGTAQQSSVLVSAGDELMGQYISYTEEALEQLCALHRDMDETSDPGQRIDELHAIAHNIKGMGSSFDFPLMTDIGTSLCNYLRGVAQGAAASSTLVGIHLDAMHVVLDNKVTGDGSEAGAQLLARLQEKVGSAPSN